MLSLSKNAKWISGIMGGGISVKDFSMVTETNESQSKQILEELIKNSIGYKSKETYNFSQGDRLNAVRYFLEKGATIDEVAQYLNWKDFEGLVSEILESKNFATIKNVILTKPRREIDVVGIRLGVALLIDCKHWKKYSLSALNLAVEKQIQRTKQYLSQMQGATGVPAIVTLYQDKVDFIKKVPIVPIFQFSSFVDELYGNLDEVKAIKTY